MNYSILIKSKPELSKDSSIVSSLQKLQDDGHQILQIFLYGDGVSHVDNKALQQFATPLKVCVNSAEKRGIKGNALLSQFFATLQQSDKCLEFCDE